MDAQTPETKATLESAMVKALRERANPHLPATEKARLTREANDCAEALRNTAPMFVDLCQETAYGTTVRLSFQIRVF